METEQLSEPKSTTLIGIHVIGCNGADVYGRIARYLTS